MNILIQSSFDTVVNKVPEVILPQKLLYINGTINNQLLKIIIDTGATTSIIFKHTVDKLNISYIIDTEEQTLLNGIGNELSIGRIWYIEVDLNKHTYPMSLIVSNNKISDFDMIIGINFLKTYKTQIDFNTNSLNLYQNQIQLMSN
jgi:predicted aspartyl protease